MSANSNGADRPPVDFDQEVRFAVVMYGGSSLAIYINGVAQEILRLVRATAPKFGTVAAAGQAHLADEELRGSERVYRLLGRMIGRQGVRAEHINQIDPDPARRTPIRTRFVVDILTGTSAGGINSVYLAKALANDQNMDELKKLWITEGDIGVLLNDQESYDKGELLSDGKSYEKLKFTLDDDKGEPWSLLNSRRMYLKLLEALRGMDGTPACAPGRSPLVDELDLFVTSTDVAGRILQLRLADKVVSEYRHRNVFRFRYRSRHASDVEQNDLASKYNAFLAFAARATSAHQAAFSPVNLGDATLITGKYALQDELPPEHEASRIFYQDYLLQRGEKDARATSEQSRLAKEFSKVWFVDGGTLDNKPFSFVIDELPLRHADTFVDRKLLYIEPAPEHLKRVEAAAKRPRIVGNAVAALSSLPRYETIVEDLTRLLERNRLIERLDHIMRGMEQDFVDTPPQGALSREQLLQKLKDPEAMRAWVKSRGTAWGGYQRLRVAEVTDDLTLLVARAAGFDEESDEFLAVRYLVRHWRDSNYDPHMDGGKRSQVEFLIDFDLMWTVRRIRFALKKLDGLACLDDDAKRIAVAALRQENFKGFPVEDGDIRDFRKAMRQLRGELNEALVRLRGERQKLWARGNASPFRSSIDSLKISSGELLNLLREPTDNDRRNAAEAILNAAAEIEPGETRTRNDAIEKLTESIKDKLGEVINKARGQCKQALLLEGESATATLPRWDSLIRKIVQFYYVNFEDFDQVSYPLLYSSGVGEETDIIDVFRVSPEDACSLIDESAPVNAAGDKARPNEKGKLIHKLAGTTLGDFGAFFEKDFRVNDIQWGRLDGAERIISVLLQSDTQLCKQVTQMAHRAILVEEKMFVDQEASGKVAMQALVWQALDVWDEREKCNDLLSQAAGLLSPTSTFREYLYTLAKGADPIKLFKETFVRDYEASRRFPEDATLQTATRANRVLGDMLLGYFPAAGGGSWKRKIAMWIGRRLRIFVEAAIEPDGPARRRQKHRLAACYLLSLLILVGVCYPVLVLPFSPPNLSSVLGHLAIFMVTLPLALLPLLLTAGYNLLWLKLRGKLASLLPSIRREHRKEKEAAAEAAAKTGG